VSTGALYDDGLVMLDGKGVTLRRYYFPLARAKHIPYARIRKIDSRPMNWWTGKGRLWGTTHPGYWFPLDLSRPRKSGVIVLDLGGRVKPAFTPNDPERVAAIVSQQIQSA